MKIIFICGSLEPGKDGVGDYTRRLSGELIRQGHLIKIIAINDYHTQESLESIQDVDAISINVLRLSGKESSKNRFNNAFQFIDQFNPEWISLQYVPYSFQDKGLPWRLGYQLSKLGKGKKWHIMFHELWVETTDGNSRILSYLQRLILLKLALKLHPLLKHTSLPVYKARLREVGIKSKKLPIFSNLSETSFCGYGNNRFITIAFFSQFTPRDSVNKFIEQLTQGILREGLDFRIIFIGGNEHSTKLFKSEFSSISGLQNKIQITGFLDENKLSEVIGNCDLGITPVPRHVIGKSGSVAAFLSYGIPVAAPYVKPGFESLGIGFFNQSICEAILTSPDLKDFKISAEAAKVIPEKLNISSIANKFILDLAKKSQGENSKTISFPRI